MKKTIVLSMLLGFTFTALCQNNIKDFQLSSTGVKYKVEKANPNGQQVKEGDVIIGHFSVSFGDSLVVNGFDYPSQPLFGVTQQAKAFKGDMMDALLLMKQGETTIFAFSKDSMQKAMPGMPAFKGDYVFYKVQVDSLTTIAHMEELQKQQAKERQHMADSLKLIEQSSIQDYLTKNAWDTTLYEGIYVKILHSTNGKKVNDGDMVHIDYEGRLLNGKLFDTSVESVAKANNLNQPGRKYEPLEFQLGTHRVVQGFESAAKQMAVGDKIEVLIPSALAYGERGAGQDIMPYTPLLFTMTMVSAEKGPEIQQQTPQIQVAQPTKQAKPAKTNKKATKTKTTKK